MFDRLKVFKNKSLMEDYISIVVNPNWQRNDIVEVTTTRYNSTTDRDEEVKELFVLLENSKVKHYYHDGLYTYARIELIYKKLYKETNKLSGVMKNTFSPDCTMKVLGNVHEDSTIRYIRKLKS